MTQGPRLACLVPFCRRTHHNREGFGEWICGPHWTLVPKRWRRYLAAAKRAWRRSPSEANAARCDRLTRRQKGFEPGAPRPRAKKAERPVKHIPLNTFRPEPERVEHTGMPAIDPLVLAIAEAIAPLIRDQLANQRKDMEALKTKADKWDAISGLVREA